MTITNPSICIACIARNEARDIPRMLRSVLDIADRIVVVDTGSTDKTLDVAREVAGDKLVTDYYLEASKQVDGQWLLADFSKARNRSLAIAEKLGCTHALVLDADDELMNPEALRRYTYWSQIDAFAMWIQDRGTRWMTHRCWKLGLGIHYEGRAHEYPILNGKTMAHLKDVVIEHHAEPGEGQENSNLRNRRLLTDAWNEDGPNPRTAFYLANTHRDGGRLDEACWWYNERILMGEHYRDEWLFSHLYWARCLRGLMKEEEASKVLRDAIREAPDWCEFHMELAQQRYDHCLFQEAIEFAQGCVDHAIPHTELWREPNCYTDRPPRLISWCYDGLGKWYEASVWAEIAAARIKGPDPEWDARREALKKRVMQKAMEKVA